MLECLLFAPLCAGLLMLLLGNTSVCRGLLLLTAVLHTALSVKLAADVSGGLHPQALAGLLAPDALGTLFLVLASVLFLVASVYGVGYKPAPAYADTVNHWAKADIDFAASRGLLAETGEATFTPDGTMTRGMFVAALGRLAGIDPAAYPSSRFSDVAATAYYAPYVEWAFSNGIIIGAGEKTFAPDAAVTREGHDEAVCGCYGIYPSDSP